MRSRNAATVVHRDEEAVPRNRTLPAAKAPAKHPPAHDVVTALQAEHRYAARLLDMLEEHLAAVARGRSPDREALRAGMTYMTQHLDGYHHLREDALFARLVKRDARLAKRIEKVGQEHRSIGVAGKNLLAELERPPTEARRADAEVIAGVGAYVDAMRAHMAFEERDLLPRARQLLDAHDQAEIDRAFTRVIDPIFEASVRDAVAAYNPVVRYLVEQPAIREVVGALDRFLESAMTLGETLFRETAPQPLNDKPARAPGARKASRRSGEAWSG